MASLNTGRRTNISLKYNGKNVSKEFRSYIRSITYTDNASGESDSLDIELSDPDERFLSQWFPADNDRIKLSITTTNFKLKRKDSYYCGKFYVDDISFSGEPVQGKVSALAIPVSENWNRKERTETWGKTTMKAVCQQIAKRYKLTLYFQTADIPLEDLEQSQKTDSSFLYNLCETYGLAMKVYANRLIVFDEEEAKAKKPVRTIKRASLESSWSYRRVLKKYTGAKVSYTDPVTKETTSITIGTEKRLYNTSVKAYSYQDAKRKANAALKKANRETDRLSIPMFPDNNMYAGCVVKLTGFKKISGLYYVDKIRRVIDKGYRMEVEMLKI